MRRTMILVPVTALVGAAVLWLGSRDGSTPRPTDSTVSEGSIFEGASRLPPRVVDAGGQPVKEVEASLRAADADEARLLEEIAKVDAQAGYYDSLAGEMKRDLQPPTLSGLIRSLRW